ncbi:S41 family peptidase [Candidatus Latescibacterota bacterium]
MSAVALMCTVVGVWGASTGDDPYASVNASWDRFGAVYSRVLEHYYDVPDHDRIIRAAIDGMLKELDSYSQFFDEEGLRQLRQDTSGKFAGLGITVGIKEHYPVVIAPIEDTPADRAGLVPGDLIVAVEGLDTFGMSLEEVVTTLRGDPGTIVRITVARPGRSRNWDVVLQREIITIESVSLAGQIAPGVGYVGMRQTRFSEDTGSEVEAALDSLRVAGARGLILDLRGNPGGLLSQAVEVADLFLEKGDPIVTVRNRDGEREETRYSQHPPTAGELPLIVLIDGGSASAAEIVAGAVQDNDRGLVVGATSFGKGSVQTIFDLRDGEAAALKLTTALYHTPSGRSIHRTSLASAGASLLRIPAGGIEVPAALLLAIVLRAPDPSLAAAELRARFGLDEGVVDRVLRTPIGDLVGQAAVGSGQPVAQLSPDSPIPPDEYLTRGGRKVYGGGGVTPDLEVPVQALPAYVRELRRQRVFFDFVVEYVGADSALANGDRPREVDDVMLMAFKAFIDRSDLPQHRHWDGHEHLEALRELADEAAWDPTAVAALDSLAVAINLGTRGFSPETEVYIRAGLRRELALRLSGKRASLLTELRTDPQVQEAVSLLMEPERYRQYLPAD